MSAALPLHCGLLSVPHPMLSQPCNQNLLLFAWSDATEWILAEGSLLGLQGNHVSTGTTFSFLTSGAHYWHHTGIEWTMMDPGLGEKWTRAPCPSGPTQVDCTLISVWFSRVTGISAAELACKASWERCTFTEKAWRFGFLCNLGVQSSKVCGSFEEWSII